MAIRPGHGTSTMSVIISPTGHPDGSNPGPFSRQPDGHERAFVSGVSPGSTLVPLRITRSVALDDYNDKLIVAAIDWFILLQKNNLLNVGVVSISLGHLQGLVTRKTRQAILRARQHGIIIIAAGGQIPDAPEFAVRPLYERFGIPYPASDRNVIGVAGCDFEGKRYESGFYSQDEVDITAPSVNVWVARAERDRRDVRYFVERSSGTSYSTAITAGACALWMSHHGRATLTAKYGLDKLFFAFKHCLQESSDKNHPGWANDPDNQNRGAGILDADALLRHPLPSEQVVNDLSSEGQ